MTTIGTTLLCPFCPVQPQGTRKVDRQVLFESRCWSVLFDYKPLTKGHLILIPKEHRETRFDLNEAECQDLYHVCQRVKGCYEHALGYSSNLQYEKNGMGIPHFQIHIIPASSKLHLLWMQIKLFVRTFMMPLWSLSNQQLDRLKQTFTPPS